MLWGGKTTTTNIDENAEIISLEYLKRKAESIINWAASINKEIFSEK